MATQNPLGGILRLPGLAFSQAPWITPGPFSGPWCSFGFSSCPPHSPKSPSTSRFHGRSCESDDVAFFRSRLRRPGGVLRSARYPCPISAGTVPPGRLHSSTGLPYLIGQPRSLATCAVTHRPDCSGAFLASVSAALSFPEGSSCHGRFQPHGSCAPVWASLSASLVPLQSNLLPCSLPNLAYASSALRLAGSASYP